MVKTEGRVEESTLVLEMEKQKLEVGEKIGQCDIITKVVKCC